MLLSRKWLKVWLTASILWFVAHGIMAYAGGFFPGRFQVGYQIREDIEPWKKEWQVDDPLRKPLYEIIRSPSAEKLPVTFQWRGYQGPVWNQHVHSRKDETFEFPDGSTLDLPKDLNEADRQYIKQYFWDHRWSRYWKENGDFVKIAFYGSLTLLGVMWALYLVVSGGKPVEEKPRLPYSPSMTRLRKITLIGASAIVVFWVAIAAIGDPRNPQTFVDALFIVTPLMFPAIAAIIMSLLWRGPIFASVLLALSVYMSLPELAVRLLPVSWLAGD
jgi:hypothetical protein